jgi:hypothetical protein
VIHSSHQTIELPASHEPSPSNDRLRLLQDIERLSNALELALVSLDRAAAGQSVDCGAALRIIASVQSDAGRVVASNGPRAQNVRTLKRAGMKPAYRVRLGDVLKAFFGIPDRKDPRYITKQVWYSAAAQEPPVAPPPASWEPIRSRFLRSRDDVV